MSVFRHMAFGVGTVVAALSTAVATGAPRQQAPPPEITVYKSPT